MKKILPFFLIVIVGLLFGCKLKDELQKEIEAPKRTQLFVQNQSSFSVKSVKFNGATFEGKSADSFVQGFRIINIVRKGVVFKKQ